jgi:hypothetical protein
MPGRPPPWCSHMYAMKFEGEVCWCTECPARWELVWGAPAVNGRRVPKAWQYAE